ncbi:Grx4 family monothiol glutaredoxin [Candidatus Tisiphia endosymbiont of Xenochironomus xenolabis]|uniref:Grx4 family monothiol glutaredoxin n=1 Tax=Candidatus Tisiphia endosymbiont of Xenochironomus xenolabis TaxID=3139334 RepID=UPI0035C891E6
MLENKNFDFITNEIANNDVVLFMKGTSNFPQCNFSAIVVSILKKLGIEFRDINVLTSLSLREDTKSFSDWPTIPQLYIKGEFIGGCDIVREMYENGDLISLLKDKHIIP